MFEPAKDKTQLQKAIASCLFAEEQKLDNLVENLKADFLLRMALSDDEQVKKRQRPKGKMYRKLQRYIKHRMLQRVHAKA